MSKALIISDVHLHRWSYGSTLTKDGFNSRLQDQLNYLFTVRNIACENGVKHVICLGDLFHTHSTVHAEVLHAAASFVQVLNNVGIKFHCIVGNHDMASKDGKIHTLDWLRHVGHVIDHTEQFEIAGRRIVATPYTENVDDLKRAFENPKHRNVELFLLHQGINLNDNQGSAWVINEVFTKELVPSNVQRVLTGHYHKPCDDGRISIVGSPMEHTWSDYDGAVRGVILLDLETLAIERIENDYSPRFLKMKYGQTENVENRFVRLLNCRPNTDIGDIRETYMKAGARSVEFEIKDTKEKVDVQPTFTSFDQIVKEYDESVDGRRREVGRLLRDSLYETP